MTSGIDLQALQAAQTALALHQGSADLARIGQHAIPYDAATTTSATVETNIGDDAGRTAEAFAETKKAEAIKAYLTRKS